MRVMEKQTFAAFYDLHFRKIYRFVFFRVGGNREHAEDLTHDIFLKALEAFDRYDPSISGSAWIYTIARNHIINQAAKNRPQADLEDVENSLWDTQDWESVMAIRHDEGRLMKALGQIPQDEADLIRMKYLEGWRYEEIAECLGRSSGALRVQSCRILRKLRVILKQK
jgi:RNA polymerase sigma-70 factor, ECF subfamily